MARGEAHEESDLDVLILVNDDDRQLRELIFKANSEVEAELGYPFAISPCIMTESHFQELLSRERLFAQDIKRDGIAV